MMTLETQLAELAAQRGADRRDEYRAMVVRISKRPKVGASVADALKPDEVAWLGENLPTLGVSPADFERDVLATAELRDAERVEAEAVKARDAVVIGLASLEDREAEHAAESSIVSIVGELAQNVISDILGVRVSDAAARCKIGHAETEAAACAIERTEQARARLSPLMTT